MDAPPHMVAELIEGKLYVHPRPGKPHTQTTSSLGAQLHVAFQLGRGGPGGWWILNGPEVHLGDVAGWLRAEVPVFDAEVSYYLGSRAGWPRCCRRAPSDWTGSRS